jgi:NAD+ kinase
MDNLTIVKKTSAEADQVESALLDALKDQKVRLRSQLVVAIGGDGTMLRAIREHHNQDVLFVGVSAGHLGFLQVVRPSELPQLVEALDSSSYSVISAPLLQAQEPAGKVLGYAFNDISVERCSPSAAKFSVQIGQSSGSFIGDGVIFATPLGSTAYSLAASGPIIDSSVEDVFVVTPNNPHVSELYSTLQRPHVLSRSRRVKIQFDQEELTDRPVRLATDGLVIQERFATDLEISLSDKKVKLIQLSEHGFHDRIESKRLGRS